MSNKYPGGLITSGAPAGYSVAFDGTGDYLQAGSNAALAPGSGNFTVEFFVYPVGSANFMGLYQNYTDGLSRSTAFRISINGTDNTSLVVQTQASALITTSTGVMTANAWNHVALVRNGSGSNNLVLYVNGVSRGTATNTTNFSDGFAQIGNTIYNGTNYTWNGYISNFRLVVGTALYTAAFTPPTQLFNVPNTSLLTCNSPAIVDQSSNNFTITANGNAAVSTFTPFQGYVAYNPALGAATPGIWTVSDAIQAAQTRRWNMYDPYFNYTTLLLHGNGTNGAQNNTFLDSSSNNFTITRNGNTTQGTFSPFSQTGWSNYFNGSSDYLTTNSSTALNLSTNDFTVECFVNVTTASNQVVIAGVNAAAGTGSWQLQLNYSSAQVRFFCKYGGGNALDLTFGTGNIPANAWNHIAVTRSGANLRVFLNGTQIGTTNTTLGTSSIDAAGANYKIGQTVDAYPGWYLSGYLSNIRVVIGTALYTSNFTPNTTPLTAVTNTALLTCQSNRFIDNSTNALTLTPTGSPSVQAFSPFYPVVAYTPQAQGGSGYFDGSGDYLTTGTASALNFGTGNFTIEAWYYLTSTTNLDATMIADGGASYTSTSKIFKLYWFGQNFPALDLGSGNGSVSANNTAARLNQWNHVALVRSGNTFTMYLNGVAGTPVTFTGSVNFNGNNNTFIGFSNYNTPTNGYFTGYIAGLRATNTAVYSANFTPPIAPPTSVSGTSLLLNYTNAGIIDSTGDNVLETVGNAQISTTQSKFGGSSMYFDGTGDYLTAATNPAFLFNTGDFTVELWYYPTALTGTPGLAQALVGMWGPSSSNASWLFYLNAGNLYWYTSTNGSTQTATMNAASGMSAGSWYHLALCRSGGTTRIFVNGSSIVSTTTSVNLYNATCPLTVGYNPIGGTPDYVYGYIDELRITKGYARYTANFTPQTSQWQDQ